jgi:NADPH:quinone reductase-like Zn-dependent oxidoreductase
MQAAAIDQFGGIEALKFVTLELPEVGPDEILIHVQCAGVGVWDPFEIEGGFAKMFGTEAKFPYVPGADGAGIVEAVGDNVSGFKEGERVYGISLANPKGGFYAEYIVLKAANAAHVPDKLTIEQAGVLPVDGITALEGLETIGLKAGESLIIAGASGGIGHIAVQLAKRMGARVLAIASGGDGVELAKRIGADMVIDGHKDDVIAAGREFAPDGIDAALLTAGGDVANKALECLREGGRAAYPNGVEPEPDRRAGVDIKSYDGIPNQQVFEKLNRLVEAGPFEVHIGRTFSLDQAAEANLALESHFLGKIALRTS